VDLVGHSVPLVPWRVLGPLLQVNWFHCLNSNWWIVPQATEMKDVKARYFFNVKKWSSLFCDVGKTSEKKNCLSDLNFEHPKFLQKKTKKDGFKLVSLVETAKCVSPQKKKLCQEDALGCVFGGPTRW